MNQKDIKYIQYIYKSTTHTDCINEGGGVPAWVVLRDGWVEGGTRIQGRTISDQSLYQSLKVVKNPLTKHDSLPALNTGPAIISSVSTKLVVLVGCRV